MKPLPGSGGSGFGYTPAAAAPAPVAPAPVAAAPAPVAAAPADPFAAALAAYNQAATPAAPAPAAPVTPAFTEGSSVASGSVWASLAGSQQMKVGARMCFVFPLLWFCLYLSYRGVINFHV